MYAEAFPPSLSLRSRRAERRDEAAEGTAPTYHAAPRPRQAEADTRSLLHDLPHELVAGRGARPVWGATRACGGPTNIGIAARHLAAHPGSKTEADLSPT